jgi:hypothetical protein
MKVYLDDNRAAPEGWTLARSADEAITLLRLESSNPTSVSESRSHKKDYVTSARGNWLTSIGSLSLVTWLRFSEHTRRCTVDRAPRASSTRPVLVCPPRVRRSSSTATSKPKRKTLLPRKCGGWATLGWRRCCVSRFPAMGWTPANCRKGLQVCGHSSFKLSRLCGCAPH